MHFVDIIFLLGFIVVIDPENQFNDLFQQTLKLLLQFSHSVACIDSTYSGHPLAAISL